MNFKAGDVVRLKSGGAQMTVEDVGEATANEGAVWCIWFDKSELVQRHTFSPVVLEKLTWPEINPAG